MGCTSSKNAEVASVAQSQEAEKVILEEEGYQWYFAIA